MTGRVARFASQFWIEFWRFGIKQAQAALFGGLLLFLIILTQFWYPFDSLYRYDFLFLAAIGIQALLLLFRLETWREAGVIILFHAVATVMEIFKTSEAIGSWHYPEPALFQVFGVPLFAGFMYSAVGSYIARIWRLFDFRFSVYPQTWLAALLALLVYANFFTHHFIFDFRWVIFALSLWLFGRTWIYFRPGDTHWRMPLVVGFFLVAFFIWIAENVATFGNVWLYPTQQNAWHLVSVQKILAWYLLMLISFVLVSLVNRPRLYASAGSS